MAWNESGNGKNPWDRGRGQGGPPDLDKIVREWQQRISALFGGRRRTDGPGNSSMFLVLLVTACESTRRPTLRATTENLQELLDAGLKPDTVLYLEKLLQ